MKKLKINRENLKYFSIFADENKLKFKNCVNNVFCDSVYYGNDNGTYISWNVKEETEILKTAVDLINVLLINCKLEFEEDR